MCGMLHENTGLQGIHLVHKRLLDLGWPHSTQKPLATPLLITRTAFSSLQRLRVLQKLLGQNRSPGFYTFIAQLCISVTFYSSRCT